MQLASCSGDKVYRTLHRRPGRNNWSFEDTAHIVSINFFVEFAEQRGF
jgi:hypothetical protein